MGIWSVDGGYVTISEKNPESTTVIRSQNISSRISFISELSDDHHTDSTGDTTTAINPEIGFAPQVFVFVESECNGYYHSITMHKPMSESYITYPLLLLYTVTGFQRIRIDENIPVVDFRQYHQRTSQKTNY